MILKSILVAASTLLVGSAVQALTIVPVSATGSSSYLGYNDALAIDTGSGASTTDWASNGDGNSSTLKLDLGAVYKLATVSLTDRVTSGGGNAVFVGGTTDFTTSYSLQAYTDASFTTTSGAAFIFSKTAPASPTTGVADFFDIQSTTGLVGQYIKYSVITTSGANPGLSNIEFNGSTVPEPAAWGLMISGFAMTGFAARRRRQKSVVTA